MPCYQSTTLPGGVTTTGRTAYQTEAECLAACNEGACCDGTVCTVKPQCQCQGAGQTFRGVGTVCTPTTCCDCADGYTQSLFATFSNWVVLPGTGGAEDIVLGQTWELTRACGENFWYYRGTVSPPGRCQFSICDSGYDLLIYYGSELGVNRQKGFFMLTRPANCKNAFGLNRDVELGRCSAGSVSFPIYDLCYSVLANTRLCDVTVTWDNSLNPLP